MPILRKLFYFIILTSKYIAKKCAGCSWKLQLCLRKRKELPSRRQSQGNTAHLTKPQRKNFSVETVNGFSYPVFLNRADSDKADNAINTRLCT